MSFRPNTCRLKPARRVRLRSELTTDEHRWTRIVQYRFVMKRLFQRLLGSTISWAPTAAAAASQPKDPLRPDALFPVLRDFDPTDLATSITAHRNLGAGLAAHLAHVQLTPNRTLGIDYVIPRYTDWAGMTEEAAFARAWENLDRSLRVGRIEEPGEPLFLAMEHALGVAAAIVGMPGFHATVSEALGVETVFVAI